MTEDTLMTADTMSKDESIRLMQAEIERLRHEVKLREQICADATLYARRLQEADDEIERLRKELADAHGVAQACEIRAETAETEIERLRGENLARGNALGRIAVALFGDRNNRTDEECVVAAAEVGYGLAGCREKVARQAEEIERLRGSQKAALTTPRQDE